MKGITQVQFDWAKRNAKSDEKPFTLHGYDLKGIDLAAIDRDYMEADMRGCDFRKALNTESLVFYGANLHGAIFSGCTIDGCVFRNANLEKAEFATARARQALFTGARLWYAKFDGADLFNASFRRADARDASFFHTDLRKVCFEGTILRGSDLVEANASEANFAAADLEFTRLSGTNFTDAILHRTILTDHSTWDWIKDNNVKTRSVKGRTLCLASRTPYSIMHGEGNYQPGTVYKARWESESTSTSCHPGLYILGGVGQAALPVVFWLDEATVGVGYCRVKRFRVLYDNKEFRTLKADCMDDPCAVELPVLK